MKGLHKHLGQVLGPLLFGLLAIGCANEGDGLNRFPTRSGIAQLTAEDTPTPLPTSTSLPTPTMSPTPTATLAPWRVRVDGLIPADMLSAIEQLPPGRFELVEGEADLTFSMTAGEPVGEFVYAAVSAFPTVRDSISVAELQGSTLVGSAETAAIWQPIYPNLQLVDRASLSESVWQNRAAIAIVPFDQLTPDLKVLAIDGQSPLKKELDLNNYPLRLRVGVSGNSPALEELKRELGQVTNRDIEKMTRVAMTGVTALVRATAAQMEYSGILFPGEVVAPILQGADVAHISNEVPFAENCPYPNAVSQSVVFCSRDGYFQLLEHLGIDIVEVTGNHSNDYGTDAMVRSLKKYQAAGMNYYGGGINHSDALQPAFIFDQGNKIAFVGCNSFGPVAAWATADRPGAANCGDMGEMVALVSKLSAEGFVVITTFQYEEIYSYSATASQKRDFGLMADAGAAAVSGSQSHHPQAFAFQNGSYIHYGLGNLFFDQMFTLGTRQMFIDQYVIYDGRLVSVELWTGLIEHYSRPREMTPAERAALLNSVFRASGW